MRFQVKSYLLMATGLVGAVVGATTAHAEGSAQLGINGRVQTDTALRIDVLDPLVERIGWRGAGTLTVVAPDGVTPVAVLESGQQTGALDAFGAGAYRLALSNPQGAGGLPADWDVGIFGADGNARPVDGGRLYSAQWNITTGDRSEPRALDTSFFALVPGGAPETDAVVEVQFSGVNGNFHRIGMNGTGVDGRTDGRSGPENSGYTPVFPLYLTPPTLRIGGAIDPTLTNFSFATLPGAPDAETCRAALAGSGGFFQFETNAAARYRIVCDTDGSGTADFTDPDDLLLIGATVAGANIVGWDGSQNGLEVPVGTYACEVFVANGELHFLGQDIETAFPGIRIYESTDAAPRPLSMFWDDSQLPDPDVRMPDGEFGLATSGPNGVLSGPRAANAQANVDARSWGDYSADGKRGGNEVTDTYAFSRASERQQFVLDVVRPGDDRDADGLSDLFESCRLGTNPDDADTDDDGVGDGLEPLPDTDSEGDGFINALDPDSDNDGLADGTELGITGQPIGTDLTVGHFVPDADPNTTTDPLDADSDDGTVADGTEDFNLNGAVDAGERDPNLGADDVVAPNQDPDGDGLPTDQEEALGTDPNDADSDDDGVPDGGEPAGGQDTDLDGDINALDPDSDDDGLLDGTELGLISPTPDTDPAAGRFVPDADPATTTDPLNPDTDAGTVLDGDEDTDRNGRIDPGERDPNVGADDVDGPNPDPDGDGLPTDQEDILGTDPNDADSDDDGVPDGAERAAAEDTDGDGDINALDPDSDGDGLLDGTELGAVNPTPDTDLTVGRFVPDADPSETTDPLNPDTDAGTVRDGDEDTDRNGRVDPGERDPNVGADDVGDDSDGDFLGDALEIDVGTDPNDADSDDDGIPDGSEPALGNDNDGDGLINALDHDSDGDGLFDGTEAGIVDPDPDTDLAAGHFVPDADPSSITDPLDPDTDHGGIPDGVEDANKNGAFEDGERDPNEPSDDDSDGDRLTDNAETGEYGTDPNDADSDDDGVSDGEEPALDSDDDGDGFINALDDDSDDDGLKDGTELGVTVPGPDTEVAAGHFVPDADPDTTTNPRSQDTDDGGIPDGFEDANLDGAIDPGEGDPNDPADDLPPPDDDPDLDGLTNDEEAVIGTNPNDGDSDDDGVADGAEPDLDLDTDRDGDINALDPDSDNDGLNDGTEMGVTEPVNGTDEASPNYVPDADPEDITDPTNPDTDEGGVPDGVEDTNHDGAIDAGEGDPNNPADDRPVVDPDTDDDGLSNDDEANVGTDPNDADTDDDGVSDGAEVDGDLDSDGDGDINALDPDSDDDGVLDGTEIGLTEPTDDTDEAAGNFVPDADPDTTTDPTDPDSDNGSVSDGEEDTNHNGRVDDGERDPNDRDDDVPDGPEVDTDEDGVPDDVERANGLDPEDPDSDGDGIDDGAEFGDRTGGNPRDTDSDDIPDALDRDSDGDTITDADESGDTNLATPPVDTDDDGTPDYLDLDTDSDTRPDADEAGDADLDTPPVDTDGDGTEDFRDPDSDNDAVDDRDDACPLESAATDDGCSAEPVVTDPAVVKLLGGGGCSTVQGRGPGAGGLLLLLAAAGLRRRTRRLQRIATGATLAGLTALPGVASAADGFQVQRLTPAPGGDESIIQTQGPRVPEHLRSSAGLVLHYAYRELSIEGDTEGDLINHHLQGDLVGSLALWERFELGLAVPVTLYMGAGASADTTPGFTNLKTAGMGDLRFIPKLKIFQTEHFAIALAATITAPTGDENALLGAGTVTGQPTVLVGWRSDMWRFTGNLGYLIQTSGKAENLDIGNELTYSAGAGFHPDGTPIELLAELFGRMAADSASDIKQETVPFEGLGGVRWNVATNHDLTAMAGTGLTHGYGAPRFRVLLGYAFTDKAPRDTDGDGLIDPKDACPLDPEDKDDFEDSDGCPDPDNDKDGILDVDDKCPLDPEDKDAFEDVDGCPDPDNDKDGILDVADTCPNEPEDKDGFEDTDGCPDPDNDKDGLLDVNDKCPNDPEDKDGFEDTDGCPDPDNDKDGILDVNDKCPNEPETVNGVDDTDGCPDGGSKVRIVGDRIEIMEIVHFDFAKSTIQKVSFDLLNQVAAVISNHPEISKIRVEGHTDSKGNDAFNLKLSQGRANAVRQYLVKQGIEGGRLTAVGYGETRPVESNTDDAGRAKNRRVEFMIENRAAP